MAARFAPTLAGAIDVRERHFGEITKRTNLGSINEIRGFIVASG
jgi:hypothetical protein